jgi:hypothetical protein
VSDVPTAYLTSVKNLDGMLSAIQTAQAPPRFTLSFLENLGYKSSSDRLIINVLKALDFLNADGKPSERYYRFLDQSEAPKVLAEALRDAYAGLFQLNRNAQNWSRTEVRNKLKTLTQGQYSDSVLNKMAGTFLELAKHADFDAPAGSTASEDTEVAPDATAEGDGGVLTHSFATGGGGGGSGDGRVGSGAGGVNLGGLLHDPDSPTGVSRSGRV